MSDDEKLIGKTIVGAQIGGYGVELKFSDGSILDYSSSDGGYSSWEIIDDTKQAEMNEDRQEKRMSRYIDRYELLKEAYKDGAYGYVSSHEIKNFPAADVVEVKHGRWEYIGGYGYQYRCSKCFKCHEHVTLYCPHCGAKMDGAE